MRLFNRLLGPPSPDKYARLFVKALREAGDQREARYDRQEFCLRYEGERGVTNLRNLYDEYCAAPRGERNRLLHLQIRGALSHLKEMPEDFEDAKCDIYPKIWARATLEKTRLQQQLEGGGTLNIPSQVIAEHLEASLAFDLPEAVRTISQEDLDAWGVTYYEALEIARENLETTDFAFARIGENLYASLTGDTYDATRVLLVDLIRRLEVQGAPIAMTPNRDTLLLTGSEDEVGLGMMAELAENALTDQPRPMAATPMRLDGDQWLPWMPAEAHPLFEQFQRMEVRFLHQEYEAQKLLLDAINEKGAIDVFVASYSAVQKRDTGDLVSYCVWTQGVETLLPQAQKVAFVRGENDIPALSRWDRVAEVVGHRMRRTDDYPARFHVETFPTDKELAEIGLDEM